MPLSVGKTPIAADFMVQGKSFYREYTVLFNGAPFPGGITGASISFYLRLAPKETGAPVLLMMNCGVVDGPNAIVYTEATSAQTAALASGQYYAEGEMTIENGEVYGFVYFPGSFIVDTEVV